MEEAAYTPDATPGDSNTNNDSAYYENVPFETEIEFWHNTLSAREAESLLGDATLALDRGVYDYTFLTHKEKYIALGRMVKKNDGYYFEVVRPLTEDEQDALFKKFHFTNYALS